MKSLECERVKPPMESRGTCATIGAALVLSALGTAAWTGPAAGQSQERVHYCYPGENGTLNGGAMMMDTQTIEEETILSRSTTLLSSGDPANRIDLVFVGDGYDQFLLSTYATHVDNALQAFFAEEPFRSYKLFFNAHRVDVISNDIGVDNDPDPGVERDTAMDMKFWCAGVERFLCIDTGKAHQYASNAPEVDQIWAIANSTKYGGAGYTLSELCTLSGGNELAPEIAVHETGHTLGNLADEYWYTDDVYWGEERPEHNVSILDESAMRATGSKWANWINDSGEGYGGPIGTYEGAYNHKYGIYRPTVDSKMRTLGEPFNNPSIEGLILEMYGFVTLIDSSTPDDVPLTGTETVVVRTVLPLSQSLKIEWYVDGVLRSSVGQGSINEARFNLASTALLPGEHELAFKIKDNTPFVRNELLRENEMTEWRYWTIDIGSNPADVEPIATSGQGQVQLRVSPNPVFSQSVVSYQLPGPSLVQVKAFDAEGRLVSNLVNEAQAAGDHEVTIETDGLSAGAYFVRLASRYGTVLEKFIRVD